MSILDHLEARPGQAAENINRRLWSAEGSGWDTAACWRQLQALGSEPGLGIARLSSNNSGRCVLSGWLIPQLRADGLINPPQNQPWAMEISTPHQAWSWAWHFEPPHAWAGVSDDDALRCAERARAWALMLQDLEVASLWWPSRPDGSHWTVWCLTQDRWVAKQLRELERQAALHPNWQGMMSEPGMQLRHHRLVRPPGVPSPHTNLGGWAAQPLDINASGYQPLTHGPAQALTDLSNHRLGKEQVRQLIQAAGIADPTQITDPWGMEFYSPILRREAARLRTTSKEPQAQAWVMGCRLGRLVLGRLQQMRESGVEPENIPDTKQLYQRAQVAARTALVGRWQDNGQQGDLAHIIQQGLHRLQNGWDRGMSGAGVQLPPWTATPEGYPRPWDANVQPVDDAGHWLERWTWQLVTQHAKMPRSRLAVLQTAETCWQQMAKMAPLGQTNRLQAPVSVRQVSKRWGVAPIVASRAIRQLDSDGWLDQVSAGNPRVRVFSGEHRSWSSLARVIRICQPPLNTDQETERVQQLLASWNLDPGDLLAAAGWLGARAALTLAALQHDPQRTWTAQQLAQTVGMSTQSVRYQMRRLQQAQMIRTRRVMLDGRRRLAYKLRPWAQQLLAGKPVNSPAIQRWAKTIDPRLALVLGSVPPRDHEQNTRSYKNLTNEEALRGAFEDRWEKSGPLARAAMLARSPRSAQSWARGRTQARWDQARWQLACSLQRDGQRLGHLPTTIQEQGETQPDSKRPWNLEPVLQHLQETQDPRAAQMVAWHLATWVQRLAADPDPQIRHLVPHIDMDDYIGWLHYKDPTLAAGVHNAHMKAIRLLAEHEQVQPLITCAHAALSDSRTLAWCIPLHQRRVPSRMVECPGAGTLPVSRRT
jgi:DNA-binding MarR family transcriptional regulator